MGIETTVPSRKENKALHPSPEETNSISKPRKSRRRHRKMSPVQKLYETCKVVFSCCSAGIVPSSEDIQKLCPVLGTYFLILHDPLLSSAEFKMLISEFCIRIEFNHNFVTVFSFWTMHNPSVMCFVNFSFESLIFRFRIAL